VLDATLAQIFPPTLEQDDFPLNRHLALILCFVACPDAKPVPTWLGALSRIEKTGGNLRRKLLARRFSTGSDAETNRLITVFG
jgi:hypothetical protein